MKIPQHNSLASLGLLVGAAAFLSMGASPARAVLAYPGLVDFVQPDGARIQLRARGDEFLAWHENVEGYAVQKDPLDGFWKFAEPIPGRSMLRAVVGARVDRADPAALRLTRNPFSAQHSLPAWQEQRRQQLLGEPVEVQASEPDTPPLGPPQPIPVTGIKTVRNIVILAAFSDHWNASAGTVNTAYGRVSTSEYANLFNQVGHTSDGAVGSVRDYYTEVSYGRLTLQSTITVWVRLPNTEAYYATGNPDPLAKEMVRDAINAADTAGFDFSQGDSDGDGWVDCLTVIHSGYGQEYGNPLPDTRIWSHKGSLSTLGPITKDGVRMQSYHTEPALRGSSGTGITRIGVVCHELGHFFGLPDLYDYSGTTAGLGNWCIMASGSWNGSDGKRPAHLSAWCKVFLGFVSPTLVHSQGGLPLPRVEDTQTVGMLRDGMSNGEYFLIENRAKTGFDNDSAIFPGLLIYHVDTKSANNSLSSWPHPAVKLEEADGDDSLGSRTASSEAGDVWTSSNGLADGFQDWTGSQSANAMRYQSSAYNRADDANYYSYTRLNNFSDGGDVMTLDATTLKPTVASQTVDSFSYTVGWPACFAATKYEIQTGARTTLTSFFDGAEDEDAMYANWNVGGTVKRDTGGYHSGTRSYSMLGDGASVQSLTMRKPFRVTATTALSFYYWSHVYQNSGYLKCQLSNDGGNTWKTLATIYNSSAVNNTLNSISHAAIAAAGIGVGDVCLLRFVMDLEYIYGWSTWPAYGYALDDISVTGIAMDGYAGWTTLDDNVAGTSYVIPEKVNGAYVYRVQAYANGSWQGFGTEGEITVADCSITTAATHQQILQTMQMTFTNVTGLASVQALTLSNCTVSGIAYASGDVSLGSVGPLSLTARTELPTNTVKVVLTATKVIAANSAAVNVVALDTCGHGKSFDPVITTLEVTDGHCVQQRFDGLLPMERFLHIVNGTPGLERIEINLNGRAFRVEALCNGQSISSDVGRAMHEHGDNVLLLSGYGNPGASALVMLTDTNAGDLVDLVEDVTLTLAPAPGGLKLTWPDTLAGWRLQSCATVEAGWADLIAQPAVADGQFVTLVPMAGAAKFYRLRAPGGPGLASPRSGGTSAQATIPSTPQTLTYRHEGLLW